MWASRSGSLLIKEKIHALLKASAKDYVRDTQSRLILIPVINGLLETWGSQARLEAELKRIVSMLRETHPHIPSYATGNILNLLLQLQTSLRGYDFSGLVVNQAYLSEVALSDVNFARAHFENSVFPKLFGPIYVVELSPNGQLLAAGTENEIRCWNASYGVPLFTYHGHTSRVRSVAFSPDGSGLASGSDDRSVRLWDINRGTLLRTLTGHAVRVWSVTFSFDGKTVISAGEDQFIRLWDIATRQCFRTFQAHAYRTYAVAFSPDGSTLASSGDDRSVQLWNITTGQCVHILKGHKDVIRTITFSPDGRIVASGSDDGRIGIWEVQTGKCLHLLRSERRCEHMNITSVEGLTDDEKDTLRELGAFEDEEQMPV